MEPSKPSYLPSQSVRAAITELVTALHDGEAAAAIRILEHEPAVRTARLDRWGNGYFNLAAESPKCVSVLEWAIKNDSSVVSHRNDKGYSALLNAAISANLDAFVFLVESTHFNINDNQSAGGLTPLIRAVESRNVAFVREILHRYGKNGLNLNQLTDDGNNALHYAGALGLTEMFDLLEGEGADASARNHNGHLPRDKLNKVLRNRMR